MSKQASNISNEAVKKATGKSFEEWFSVLDHENAQHLEHKDIAALLSDNGYIQNRWWAQSVTVAYEQKIGRRVRGQTSAGEYSVSVSSTLKSSMEEVLNNWLNHFDNQEIVNHVKRTTQPIVSQSEKWRYWKLKLDNGSRVSVNITNKPNDKTMLQINHDKLESQDAIESWRAYWKQAVKAIKEND